MRAALAAAAAAAAAAGAPLPACDMQKPAAQYCDDFCNYRCSFVNASQGEVAKPRNITLYRITPYNVTGVTNKDTGDAPGDVGFFLSKKNLTQQCARDPTGWGCFLDGNNMYGKFVVEFDGNIGPYAECNPVQHGKDTYKPDWVDTREFYCAQNCLAPGPEGCAADPRHPQRNGTNSSFSNAVTCFCDTTERQKQTVGRELMPYVGGFSVGPKSWPPQCYLKYYKNKHSKCLTGTELSTVTAWDFASAAATACDACSARDECTGWAVADDNRTATLFKGEVRASYFGKCIGGVKYHSSWSGSSWGAAGDVGGYWYNTPAAGKCAEGQMVGDGCSWRVVQAEYRNASCVDGRVDDAIEQYGKVCFDQCPQPLDRVSDCYLSCYKNTLLGDPAYNLTAISSKQLVSPWEDGFRTCAPIKPAPCEGDQCGP